MENNQISGGADMILNGVYNNISINWPELKVFTVC